MFVTYLRNWLLVFTFFMMISIFEDIFLDLYFRNCFFILDIFMMLVFQKYFRLYFSLIVFFFLCLKPFLWILTGNVKLTDLLSNWHLTLEFLIFKLFLWGNIFRTLHLLKVFRYFCSWNRIKWLLCQRTRDLWEIYWFMVIFGYFINYLLIFFISILRILCISLLFHPRMAKYFSVIIYFVFLISLKGVLWD